MAKGKGSSSSVVHTVSEAGDHAIGIEHAGVFVPFASVSAARFGQLLEHGQQSSEAGEAGEEEATTE